MKYADLMRKDTGVNVMDCIAQATKGSLNVGDARSAMNIFNEDGGAPNNSTAAMHDYYRKTQNVRWRVRATATKYSTYMLMPTGHWPLFKQEDDFGSKNLTLKR